MLLKQVIVCVVMYYLLCWLQEKQKGKNKLVPRLLGINKDSVVRLDEKTKEVPYIEGLAPYDNNIALTIQYLRPKKHF